MRFGSNIQNLRPLVQAASIEESVENQRGQTPLVRLWAMFTLPAVAEVNRHGPAHRIEAGQAAFIKVKGLLLENEIQR